MKIFYRILFIPHNIVMNMNNVMWGTYLCVIVYIQRHNWDNKSDANGKGGGAMYTSATCYGKLYCGMGQSLSTGWRAKSF